ncbi:uroporphyrinogen-III synthase [Coemansia sp. RSA 1933]|nr:uroporphyrinogen-III synthase [Coemansia sp. RSA 1933]
MESAAILFRDTTKGDRYTDPLLNDHCAVESIPVLEHKYLLDAQDIEELINTHESTSDSGGFSSLVFTSANAVRALMQAVELWLSEGKENKRHERWQRILELPIFVVGQETQAACRSLMFTGCNESKGDIRGGKCGNAATMLPQLVEFSRQYSKGQSDKRRAQLLFFCSDQRRSTIPDGIKQSGVAELVEVVSYTTVGRDSQETRADLIDSVNRIVARGRLRAPNTAMLIWMVVFSPSGVRVVAPLLADLACAKHPLLLPASTLADVSLRHPAAAAGSDVFYGYAAIGGTTMTELAASRGDGDAVLTTQADTPNPLGICNAIRSRTSPGAAL